MRIILLGPPGCGKGTQAKLLSERHALEHIATGDILRAAIRNNTPFGARAKPYVEAGHLVPDDLVNDLIAERFRQDPRPERFVLDGYPRTLAQAMALDAVLRQQGLLLTGVLLMDVPDEEIVHRVSGRWSCPSPGCKATYHTENNPPRVQGICDVCGSRLVQRADDRPETVRERLKVYHRDTQRLVPFYREEGLLRELSGMGTIDEVYERIMAAIGPQAGLRC
jgi:adenylate kinase